MTHTATDGLGARYRARTLSDGPTLAEVTVSDVADLCNTWMNTPGIAWWRKRAAREIMDTLTAEPDPTSDLAIVGMGTEHGEAVLNVAAGGPRSHAALLATVAAMGELLDEHNPPNYVEFEVITAERTYITHVCTADKPSPHTLRMQAEQRIAEVREALAGDGDPNARIAAALRLLGEAS